MARISTHVLRLEREFNGNKLLVDSLDPDCLHTIKPLDLFRLPSTPGDHTSMMVCVYEAPGMNHLSQILDFGPAFFGHRTLKSSSEGPPGELIHLQTFLDVAIGACECLELLHHGLKVVHGEIRQDTFHWNKEKNLVKVANGGNGPRSFENLLSSDGWSSVSKELGVKNKLQFIAPEQTGRLPAEPDSRTDIYSLGILFWSMLTGRPAFNADNPLDIVQKVLSHRLPMVSSTRMDVPDAVAHVIAKMTQKQMDERYNSVNGLKYDLLQIAKALGEGDQEKLRAYKVGQRDVSSFFILPSKTVGRSSENERLSRIIARVHKRQSSDFKSARHTKALVSNPSNSSISDSRLDVPDAADESDSSSSIALKDSRSNSTTIGVGGSSLAAKFAMLGRGIVEPRNNFREGSDRESQFSGGLPNHQMDNLNVMGRHRNSQQSKRGGRTEVITIIGEQGVGKSTLIKTVQPHIRRHGYFALGRFDRARPTPFEPMLKVMSSLFRQIFSERDVKTNYHDSLRSHVKPMWPVLQNLLGLPESLIDAAVPSIKGNGNGDNATQSTMTEIPSVDSRGSSDVSSSAGSTRGANDFLRGPANTRSIRFMNIYMDVLRLMSVNRVICLCLDDLHAADGESVELLVNIIRSRTPVVLMLASRQEGQCVPESTKKILDLDSTNKIELSNLKEEHVFEYVSATMSQGLGTVLPLAAAVHETSGGNPFLMKEILQTLHESNCLWYDWRASGWSYDLDRVFDELSSEQGQFDDMWIAHKFQDLCSPARSILAWASLVGMSFSWKLIRGLLNGEYFSSSERIQDDGISPSETLFVESEKDSIEGLQKLLNCSIVVPGDTDDEFRFAHARYLRAANNMGECQDTENMHFIIAQTMMLYLSECKYDLYPLARHICLASRMIKDKIPDRARYRNVLWGSAKKAAESGAKSTALWYYQSCIELLQDHRWDSQQIDVSYDETLQLLVHTAEMLSAEGKAEEALSLLDETFSHAHCSADQTPSWILRGQIFAKQGKFEDAFANLKTCLVELDVLLPPTTWDECDIEFKKLEYRLRHIDRAELLARPLSEDRRVVARGTILGEALLAVYWYDALFWYQLVIAYVNAHLEHGTFVQAGLGYNMLGAVAIGRFKDVELGLMYGEIAQEYFTLFDDAWTRGRGWTLYALFTGHFQTPIRNHLPILENALDYSLASGDRVFSILNIGATALYSFWAGQDMAEIEAFCHDGPEEFADWEKETRGGTLILATRQLARALQGKTGIGNVGTVLDDEHHNQKMWTQQLTTTAANVSRPRDLYATITLLAYYLFGYHDYVVTLGRELADKTLKDLWSHRAAAAARFCHALSLIAMAREVPVEGRAALVEEAKANKQFIDNWGSVNDVNYFAWSKILAAELADVTHVYYEAISSYEAAIDHAQVHGFAVEEALAIELQAEFLLARGSKRAGKVMIEEAIAAWNRINALGKARHLFDKHEWLLKTATTARTSNAATQTSPNITALTVAEESGEHNKKEYTQAWMQPKTESPSTAIQNVPGLGLDILDLTSILEFSRVISSELQINALLTKMTGVILESVGGQAEFCAIVTDPEDRGWCVAASGNHEDGVRIYPDGIPLADVDDQAAQHITHYILRTRETVFINNVLEDERFNNVSDAYLARNPTGRAIICIPIIQADDLMGVIHLEGRPNAFTQRNMVVLDLLSNQVAISMGNALLYRKVRKVSASNATMVESQKHALAAARESEGKAKRAEEEALRSVKLKEEAARAKSIFLANVSHELRTPLNGVIGMSELLKGTTLDKDQEGYADSIRVCADTLLTVINDILDFSKLEAGKMQMFTVPLNVKETITEVVRALAYTNQEHGLETIEDLELDEGLVLGDPVRLHQIFMNLLSNAYKFTPKGSVTVKARKTSESKDKIKVTCSVADTGIGITEEQLTRLFQPFSQADSSTARSYGGTGLGLSICKAMIENVLGGKIWIESKLQEGTTVFFTLTFKKAPKDSIAGDMTIQAKDPDPMANWSHATTPGEEIKASFCNLSKVPRDQIRVCIAEDNAINRKIAISYVKKLGFKCEAFEDGKQAYEALQKRSKEDNPFHLVLMDVQMPVLDGYEATKAIRADPDPTVQQVLVIAMTASAIRGDREKCLEAGMNDYLAKPVRQNALKAMLDEYLSNAKVAASPQVNGKTLPGDKVHGMTDGGPNKLITSGDAGIEDKNDGESKNSRPVMRTKESSRTGRLSESTNTTRSASPPSGKRQTDELGRISKEDISPKTIRDVGVSAPQTEQNGDAPKG